MNGVRRGAWPLQRGLVTAVLLMLLQLLSSTAHPAAVLISCGNELQQAECGQIPFQATTERTACCATYAAMPSVFVALHNGSNGGAGGLNTQAQPLESPPASPSPPKCPLPPGASAQSPPPRPDLEAAAIETGGAGSPLRALWRSAACASFTPATLPVFTRAKSDSNPNVTVANLQAPLLDRTTVLRVRRAALAAASNGSPRATTVAANAAAWSHVRPGSNFTHPGGPAGASELAHMRAALSSGVEPQVSLLQAMLSGAGVPRKIYDPVSCWHPPTDTPADGYHGPFAMPSAIIRYGGVNDVTAGSACAFNYPLTAPQALCGHVALVELDGQMVRACAAAAAQGGHIAIAKKM